MSVAAAEVPPVRAGKPSRAFPRLPHFFNPAALMLVCAVGLAVLGITVLFSASWMYHEDPYFFVRRQVTWLGIALIVGFIASRVNLERWRGAAWWLLGLAVLGLIAVLIPGIGISVNGSRRWLELGAMRIQVSEFAKIIMVFALAHYLATQHKNATTFVRGFFWPLVIIGVVCGLVFREPDFGTAALIGLVGMAMVFFAGARFLYVIPTTVLGIAAMAGAIALDPERRERVFSFLHLEETASDAGYQLKQAILAFGAGGIDGVGLGNGRQQMFFLPEAHTDFIFAIVGEELGLTFTLTVAATFAVMFVAGLVHVRRAPSVFHHLLVMGGLLLLTLQAVINLCVVTGLMPTKGMSLPFISYGGSNLLLMAMIVGLMINTRIAWSRPALQDRGRELKELEA